MREGIKEREGPGRCVARPLGGSIWIVWVLCWVSPQNTSTCVCVCVHARARGVVFVTDLRNRRHRKCAGDLIGRRGASRGNTIGGAIHHDL